MLTVSDATMMLVVAAIGAGSLLLVIAGDAKAKRRVTSTGAEPTVSQAVFFKETERLGLDPVTAKRVLELVSGAFEIEIHQMKLDAPLETFLDLDTWNLGVSVDRLNEGLKREFGIDSFGQQPATMLQLIAAVDQRVKARGVSR